ncbi:MAG: T9SS type A sorting domain-containing protein, partial [Candidatus Marinimicrobia bacterium]|nr:T9SS type A sorting domain-containing protein [Candidatus Neomarinimicrobiota bacterium]
VYFPFYFENILSLDNKFLLLANTFHHLNIATPIKRQEMAISSPTEDFEWKSLGYDSLEFNWQLLGELETKENIQIHFFNEDSLYFSEIVTETNSLSINFNNSLPLDIWLNYLVTYSENDTLFFSSIQNFMKIKIPLSNENLHFPTEYIINSAYPNPFNPTINLKVSLPNTADISLTIYSLEGKLIKNIDMNKQGAGTHTYDWNASAKASGIYFIKIMINDPNTNKLILQRTQKIMLIK